MAWRQHTPSAVGCTRPARGGFTLIEAALTTVIIGTGVLAIVAAQQAYHIKNDWSQRTGTGMLLANELRELTLTLPLHDPITGKSNVGRETGEDTIEEYDDVDDFAGTVDAQGQGTGLTFPTPINALREDIDNLPGWSQVINLRAVPSTDLDPPTGTIYSLKDFSNLIRITVEVYYRPPGAEQPMLITTLSWVRTE
ncbi:MAG: hypothetical protein IT443_04995 [Phycisphaeraceae bacterium]|nr:hypothetical protein [Phycisphaeraceae bacterium]